MIHSVTLTYVVLNMQKDYVDQFLTESKKNAAQDLAKGTRRQNLVKQIGPISLNQANQQKLDDLYQVQLNEDEKVTLTWLLEHNIEMPIEDDNNCPQQKSGT